MPVDTTVDLKDGTIITYMYSVSVLIRPYQGSNKHSTCFFLFVDFFVRRSVKRFDFRVVVLRRLENGTFIGY